MSDPAQTAASTWTAWSVFAFFFALVTVLGFVAARWKSSGPQPAARMGPRRPPLRHRHHLVPARRGFVYRLHRGRGAGAGIRGRRLRFLCDAVYDHRVSDRVRGDAAAVERVPPAQLPDHRGFRRRPLRQSLAGAGGRAHRRARDDAVHRAATGRHAGGVRGHGFRRRCVRAAKSRWSSPSSSLRCTRIPVACARRR